MFELTLALGVLFLAIYLLLTRSRHLWPPMPPHLKGTPSPPRVSTGISPFGPAGEYGKRSFSFLQECKQKYGNVFEINLVVMKAVFVMGEKGMKQVFKAAEEDLSFEEGVGDFSISIMGENPFKMGLHLDSSMVGLKAALHPNMMAHYTNLARARTIKTMDCFIAASTIEADGGYAVIDATRLGDVLMSAVMVETFLGTDFTNECGTEWIDALRDLEAFGTSPEATILPHFPSGAVRRCKTARQTMLRLVDPEITKILHNATTADAQDRKDFLSAWLPPVLAKESPELLRKHTQANLILMALAARTNIMGSFTWTLVHLLSHPPSLRRAAKEAAAAVASFDGENIPDVVNSMDFLDMAMKEAARLHAPLSHQRRCMRPFEIDGYCIPAGHYVMLSPLLTHLDPTLFPDPTRYDPERFANGKNYGYAFSQWGFGKHKCLGMLFSITVLRTCFASILGSYNLMLHADTPSEGSGSLPEPDWSKVNGTPPPSKPVLFRVKKRSA